jgi:hypothetical protein
MKIISGGQIGADIAGLQIAKQLGFETGGWMPKGFKTIDGFHPEYADLYGMLETSDGGYPVRTCLNVEAADVTLRFGHNFQTYGERCTAKYIHKYMKPHLDVYINPIDIHYWPTPIYVAGWLFVYKPEIINIAGNARKDIEPIVMSFLQQTFNHYLTL